MKQGTENAPKGSIFQSLNTRIFFVSIAFTLAMLIWEYLTLNIYVLQTVPFLKFVESVTTKYLIFTIGISLGNFIVLSVFVYATIASSPLPKVFLLGIFAVAVFFEYGCMDAVGRYSELIDFQTIVYVTNFNHYLNAIWLFFNWKGLAPIILLAILAFKVHPKGFRRARWIFLLPFIISTCFYTLYSLTLKKLDPVVVTIPTISYANFLEMLSEFEISEIREYSNRREQVLITRKQGDERLEKKNIIFITDESLRADHLSVNGYSRNTTPYLNELLSENRITNYGISVSATTRSISSAKLFLTGMKISDLPDYEQALGKLPTIFQYAKAMGYKTHFLDGQMKTVWNGSFRDFTYIDDWKNVEYFSGRAGNSWDVDAKIAEEIAAITSKSTGNFIWVWKKGVHYPYEDDFPEGKASFNTISQASKTLAIRKEQLNNIYDSGIAYNVDGFFRLLMPIVERDPSVVVIYTSDHGESLLEDGKTLTHGSTNREQAIVPFIVAGNITKDFQRDVPIMHEYVFPTILDLLQVPVSARKHRYSSSLLDRNAVFTQNRAYWGTDLTKGTAIPFD